MRTIGPIHSLEEAKKNNAKISKTFSPLLEDPEFLKDIKQIRDDLDLHSARLIPLGVTDKATANQLKDNHKRFLTIESVCLTDKELRLKKIGTRSKKDLLNRKVDDMLKKHLLPQQFHSTLWSIVVYGGYPETYPHINKYQILVDDSKNGPRIFIEIFGNTTTKDLEKALKDIKALQQSKSLQKLSGAQFQKNTEFYRNKRASAGEKLKDRDGIEYGHDQLNIMKHRHRKAMKKLS